MIYTPTLHPSAQKVLDAITKFWLDNRYGPSIEDIMSLSGVGPKSNVYVHLHRLREAGYIVFDDKVPRSVRTVNIDNVVELALSMSYIQEKK